MENMKDNKDFEMIYFEKLKESDFSIMQKWLNTGFVKEWYGKKEWTYQDVVEKYLPRVSGKKPTDCFIILYGEIPIGYIQAYFIKDYPDYNKYVQADDNTAGIDMFIGEEGFIHKGLGKLILGKFLEEIVFDKMSAKGCIMGPEPQNKSAIKAYEKAGFKYIKTIYISDEEEYEYLMEIKKPLF